LSLKGLVGSNPSSGIVLTTECTEKRQTHREQKRFVLFYPHTPKKYSHTKAQRPQSPYHPFIF
jgi:hypothetical protein